MIEVRLSKDDHEIGLVQIKKTETHPDGTADYQVSFAVDRASAVGYHQRTIWNFPRTKYNVLALLKQALATLDIDHLETEDGTSASDLARPKRGARLALPAEAPDPMRDY